MSMVSTQAESVSPAPLAVPIVVFPFPAVVALVAVAGGWTPVALPRISAPGCTTIGLLGCAARAVEAASAIRVEIHFVMRVPSQVGVIARPAARVLPAHDTGRRCGGRLPFPAARIAADTGSPVYQGRVNPPERNGAIAARSSGRSARTFTGIALWRGMPETGSKSRSTDTSRPVELPT